MKTSAKFKLLIGAIFLMISTTQTTIAQTFTTGNSTSNLKIEGTSNLHDWSIEAREQKGKLVAEIVDGQLVKLSQLEFSVLAESLKSGKAAMDKNTYKALNTGVYKYIVYNLIKVKNLNCITTGSCKVTTTGTLTIAGTTKPIEIIFDAKVAGDKIILSGKKSLEMTDYKIDPPKAVFGTITTGDELKLTFTTSFTKQNSSTLK